MRSDFAAVFHEVMQLEAEEVFASAPHTLATNLPEYSAVPSAGWVGSRYASGGTILLGINPGGGSSSNLTPTNDDRKLYRHLRKFRSARGQQSIDHSFDELCEVWMEVQRHHNIQGPISLILDAIGINMDDTCFLNLVPFRTAENKPPRTAVVKAAIRLATKKQLEALAPSRVILLGQKVSDLTSRHCPFSPETSAYTYVRTNGDRYESPKALALLNLLRQQRSQSPGHR